MSAAIQKIVSEGKEQDNSIVKEIQWRQEGNHRCLTSKPPFCERIKHHMPIDIGASCAKLAPNSMKQHEGGANEEADTI